ncbi:MAG: potassium transporter TrkH [Alphaproteobacteria bacterium TMED87]|nr:potassium transporter TrkH [Rhodospirillaceae bacterium]OUV07893.1 MAG: potassium transporter TrkH [Alphaproteobacteria bacterium TMED87]
MDIDYRPIFLVLGFMLIILGIGMILPILIDLFFGNSDWIAFVISSLITCFFGIAIVISTNTKIKNLNIRQAFLITVISWVILPLFSSMPFMLSKLSLGFTDAFFESMSGITTTGATVILDLNNTNPGILIWRSILQWLGGLGIIIMAFTILPVLKVGGMQMFRIEGFETQEKLIPRATEVAKNLFFIFSALTILWIFLYFISGMGLLDATIHAMTTIATGGYSSYNSSIGYFESFSIDLIAILGMLVGSIPFLLYIQCFRGKPLILFRDSQVQLFLSIVVFFVLLITIYLYWTETYTLLNSLRYSAFNVISVITGTGYATTNFSNWGNFVLIVLFFLMFVGGCAGSTTCGIKIFRFQVLFEISRAQLKQLLQPHAIYTPHFKNKSLDEEIASSVMGFFYLYLLTVCILATLLALLGLDFLTALSGAASAVSNVGPGLGSIIGPSGNYNSVPDLGKWLLSLGMLLGRLELFTVFVLILPRFWND